MLYSILFQLLYFVLLMIDQAVVFDIKICVVDGDDYEMKLSMRCWFVYRSCCLLSVVDLIL